MSFADFQKSVWLSESRLPLHWFDYVYMLPTFYTVKVEISGFLQVERQFHCFEPLGLEISSIRRPIENDKFERSGDR